MKAAKAVPVPQADDPAAVWVARSSLHAWSDNPRKNDGEPVRKVMESIRRFGFAAPIVARKNGEVIAGHTRLKAAEALGLDRVPVRYLDLDPAEAHLLALADNKLNEEAEWDHAALASQLSAFSLDDAALAGWDSDDLEQLANELGALEPKEVVEDEVPEAPATQKPVAVIAWAIKQSETVGLIADFFLGSGTTLIAAEQLGRKCYGMEISPQYCDVIVKRWENLTGKTATLEAAC